MAEPRVVLTDIVLGESARWHDGRSGSATGAPARSSRSTDGAQEVVARVDGHAVLHRLAAGRPDALVAGPAAAAPPGGRRHPGHPRRPGRARRHLPWNDIAVDARGNAYVNNIGYDFPGGEPAPGLDRPGHPGRRGPRRWPADLQFPNGMAVTADGATLIVAESYAGRLTAFDIAADGDLTDRRVWAQLDGAARTASASTPRARSGTPTCPTSAASGSARAARCCRPSTLDRGGFACASADNTLYAVTADLPGDGAPPAGSSRSTSG